MIKTQRRYQIRFWGLSRITDTNGLSQATVRDTVIVILRMLYRTGNKTEQRRIIKAFTTMSKQGTR